MIKAPATMTHDELEQLPERELDALVAEVVFGLETRVPKRCMHTGAVHHEDTVICGDLPFYATSWGGFGLIAERMRELGWGYDVDATAPELGVDVSFHPKNPAYRVRATASTSSKAAAIAAVLAVQAAKL